MPLPQKGRDTATLDHDATELARTGGLEVIDSGGALVEYGFQQRGRDSPRTRHLHDEPDSLPASSCRLPELPAADWRSVALTRSPDGSTACRQERQDVVAEGYELSVLVTDRPKQDSLCAGLLVGGDPFSALLG